MDVRALAEKLKNAGIGSAVAAAALVGGKLAYENVAQVHKSLGSLRGAHKALPPLAYGIVGSMVGLPGSEESLAVGIAEGLDSVVDAFVVKKPYAFAKDSKTIEAFNLDADSNVDVYVDGSKVTFATPPKTDSAGHVVITLPSEMAAGKHDVLLKSSVKAWAGVVVV